ncbi:putative pumilio homolog 8, chloroplastic [Macadamia integrifolia]|uniref:putative pumilio homolog 8, chloroplastic n=1 Tax=Macadamia integrifolia TaxID=60698 RepID=UPI001C4F074B|nr:putative pumilio homolog 8, chloroplastic [Macadamia integrifolia]
MQIDGSIRNCKEDWLTIFEVAKRSCLNLAVHSQGCLTLNTCIDHMIEDHKRELLDIIKENSVFLAQDPYRNYVVQHVLRIHYPGVNGRICHKLQEFYVRLSMQKSGSHVVETCAISGGIVYVVNDLVQGFISSPLSET